DAVHHVSAFGFARLPLLVYFGSRLDDTFAVTIYQRHRSTEAWNWPDNPAPGTSFTTTPPRNLPQGAEEGVLVLNVSGSIQADELPEHLKDLPRWVINPAGKVPSVDVIDSLETLSEFTNSLRSMLSSLEAQHKHMQTLHVLAAAPVSAAVALGRVHDAHVH